MDSRTIVWDRQKIYDELWSKPATEVAKSYGISDSAIKKMCARLSIPKPPIGYWARKAHGYEDPKPGLPVLAQKPHHVTTLQPRHPSFEEISQGLPLVIPYSPTSKKSRLALDVEECYSRSDVDDYGRILTKRGRGPGVSLKVTRQGFERSIVFLDALSKLAEANGIAISYRLFNRSPHHAEHWNIVATLKGEEFRLELFEAVKQVKKDLTKQQHLDRARSPYSYRKLDGIEFVPTGRFTFHIFGYSEGGPNKWHDSTRRRIEECLPEIIQAFRIAAQSAKRRREEAQVAQKLRLAEERKRIIHSDRVRRLEQNMQSWEHANRIRSYSDALQAGLVRMEHVSTKRISRCLAWLKAYANSLDPTLRPALHEDWEDES